MQNYYTEQLISYIGNKRKLLGFIDNGIEVVRKDINKYPLNILDGFAGSGIVSRFLKSHSNILYSNDYEYYSYVIGKCYLENSSKIDLQEIKSINEQLNQIKREGPPGIIRELYSPKDDKNIKADDRVFYTNDNALIIDTLRNKISELDSNIQPFFLGPLLSEASIHVNTSGVFKGFYKNSDTKIGQFGGNAKNCLSRIEGEITLPFPVFSDRECEWKMFNDDINNVVKQIDDLDVAYYDPPYNQHPYGSNYFMLNVIAKNERPTNISKISGIPEDWYKSSYNKYEKAVVEFEELIRNTNSKYILLSYNDEGIIPTNEIQAILKKYGSIQILENDYVKFRGGRNRNSSRNRVKELLYILKRS